MVPDGDPVGPPYVAIPYVEEMQYAYAAADFVICRSGAMTCAELAAVAAGASDADIVLARHVVTVVAERRRLSS